MWHMGVFKGTVGARKALRAGKGVPNWARSNPGKVQLGMMGAAGAYGAATGDGLGDSVERGLGFATVAGLAGSKGFRGDLRYGSKLASDSVKLFGVKKGGAMMAGAALGGARGIATGAGAGALYGAFDSDTSIIGGAAAGAAGVGLGRGAAKAWGSGAKFGARTGAAGGAAVGLYAGGPVGMAVGAGIGGSIGGIGRFAKKYPKTATVAGGTALFAGVNAMVLGGSAAQAYGMHQQRRDTDFGANGDLTLGLHHLRHS